MVRVVRVVRVVRLARTVLETLLPRLQCVLLLIVVL
jgi:hypothetical protein